MNLQQILLIHLMEECAEVSQRASKALRFGIDEIQPGQPLTNATRLWNEIHDLISIVEMLGEGKALPTRLDLRAIDAKKEKVEEFLDLSRSCGVLNDGGTEEE